MIKTQIQMSDELYGELKELARRKEWSLAETLRRGGEILLQQYPARTERLDEKPWTPPSSQHAGWKGLSPDALKHAIIEDQEPYLPSN